MLVCSSTNTTFLTHKRSERPTEENDAVAPSPSRKTRPGDESHHKDRGGRPRSTRARRRRAPVDATGRRRAREYTRSSSGEPAAHVSYLKANPQQAASHSKSNTRRERITQARTTNQGPGPPPPRRPHHTSRETRQQSRATKARSRRRVPTATHSVRPQKHERRVR